MKKISFTKMVASGNDFVVIDRVQSTGYRVQGVAQKICNRKYGIGADGLLVLEKLKIADIRMRIFNADGSEAEMCGNGARCVSLWLKQKVLKIETKAGVIKSEVKGDNIKIKLTDPKDIKLDIPIKINNRLLKVNFINTGVPHTVIFVEGLDKIDVVNLGKLVRYHKRFTPAGSNVDFMEILSNNSVKIRTYERGVEDETLACGTGAVASALLYVIRYTLYASGKVNIHTKSGEILKVYFNRVGNGFKNVWLEGRAKIVYKGVYYV